jgi:gliding motility-associated protein GldM
MSIPKEPRQLMINLMYLVLTAMLALNVSAEIINAFFALDKGNNNTMQIVNLQLDETEKSLDDLLADTSKFRFRPIAPAVDEVRALSQSFIDYVHQLRNELIDAGGNRNGLVDDGDYRISHGQLVPKGKKNKDITTRILVEHAKGDSLEHEIIRVRERFIQIFSQLLLNHGRRFDLKEEEIDRRIASIKNSLTLDVGEEWKHSDKNSWTDYKFRQMPLAAVLPLLSQIQSNTKSAEATLVNDMALLSGGRVIDFDAFFPVINAKNSYVIKGEQFQSEISIGTYSSQINPDDIKLKVNGRTIRVDKDGKAVFNQKASGQGKKTLHLSCEVKNPLTGKLTKGSSIFEYEVGTRSATVSADQMNVFYIGVDNPITVSASGVPSNQLNVTIKGATMSGQGAKRIVRANRIGIATVTLSGGGLEKTDFKFRVKRIPDPIVKLGNSVDGFMKSGKFRVQLGLNPELEHFDFGAQCFVQSYKLYYTRKRADPVELICRGNRFDSEVLELVRKAKPGDKYTFTDVKVKCPGDIVARRANSLLFKIK